MELEIKRDGLTLRGYQDLPDTEEFDVAIMMHGFIQDCGRAPEDLMYQVNEKLVSLGIGTVRVDFNGHGKSDGELKDMTVLNELADAHAIISYVRSIPGVRRIFLYGHSQGGVVASIMAGLYHDVIDRVALTSAAVTLKDDAIAGTIMGTNYDPQAVPETISCMGGKVVCGGFYFRTSQVLPITEWASQYQGPVCIMQSKGDAIVNYVAAERLHAAFPNNELHLFEGGNHGMRDEVRQTVLDLIGEFFTR